MGGAEIFVTNLADELVTKGHEVRIAFMTGTAMVIPSCTSIPLIRLRMRCKFDIFGAAFQLRRLILDFQPDVVHSHMVHANILARLVRFITPMKRLISTAHSSNEGGSLRMLAYRLTDFLADISTNVSVDAVSAFVKAKAVREGRMMVVHNGIATDTFEFDPKARADLRQVLSIDENCKLILAVGRLYDAKDYPNLLYAIAEMPVNKINYLLCIAGDGPLKNKLETLTSHLGISDRVRFLGLRRDVASLMSAADIFVLSSAWEGFSLVVAEAMACERVVVATDCGGVREVVGKAGFLVKPQDAKDLSQGLQSALRLTSNESNSLGSAARQRVLELYAINKIVDQWLSIYSKKISRR